MWGTRVWNWRRRLIDGRRHMVIDGSPRLSRAAGVKFSRQTTTKLGPNKVFFLKSFHHPATSNSGTNKFKRGESTVETPGWILELMSAAVDAIDPTPSI